MTINTTHRSFRLPKSLAQKLKEESDNSGIPQTTLVAIALQKLFGEEVKYNLRLPNGQTLLVSADGEIDKRKPA